MVIENTGSGFTQKSTARVWGKNEIKEVELKVQPVICGRLPEQEIDQITSLALNELFTKNPLNETKELSVNLPLVNSGGESIGSQLGFLYVPNLNLLMLTIRRESALTNETFLGRSILVPENRDEGFKQLVKENIEIVINAKSEELATRAAQRAAQSQFFAQQNLKEGE